MMFDFCFSLDQPPPSSQSADQSTSMQFSSLLRFTGVTVGGNAQKRTAIYIWSLVGNETRWIQTHADNANFHSLNFLFLLKHKRMCYADVLTFFYELPVATYGRDLVVQMHEPHKRGIKSTLHANSSKFPNNSSSSSAFILLMIISLPGKQKTSILCLRKGASLRAHAWSIFSSVPFRG